MNTLTHSAPFLLMLVMGSYYVGVSLQKRTRIRILNPLITAMALIIPVLLLTGVEYKEFAEKTYIIHFMLGPSVVALGYILHKQIGHIRGNVGSIAAALLVGSIVGIVSVILIGKMLGSSQEVIASMQPKSVTTPIAIGISERSGGIPALTAVVVVICGILGSVIGPWLLDKLKIKGKVARGLAMGASSHGVGTARALEMGPVEGAISGMAIGLMGVITAILIPFVEKLF